MKRVLSLLILLLCFSLVGCSANSDSTSGQVNYYSIGTGGISGTYYPVGVGIAELMTKNIEGISAVAEETGGAVQNIEYLENNQIEIGFTTSGVLSAAVQGSKPFSKVQENFSIGWKLFDTPLHIVTLKDSNITTIQDLKGKRVSVGRMGAAANEQSMQVFRAHGLNPEDVDIKYIHWGEAADALLDGQLDAAVMFGAIPHPSVQAVAAVKDIVLIEPDPEAEEELAKYGLSIATVPAGTYKGIDRDLKIINDANYALIRNDIPDDVAYGIIKLVMDNKEELIKKHPASKYIDIVTLEDAEKVGYPLHPGVVKYVSENK